MQIWKVKIMGQRITQVIYECSDCGITPEDGEDVWEMYNGNGKEIICEKCIDKY